MKRTFIFALVLALCLAAIAPSAMAWTTSEPGEFPIVTDGPAELTVFMTQHAHVENMETNYATKWYEEKTGVHVNWQLASSTDAAEKVSLLLAANNKDEMPDVFFSAGISRAVADAYGAQGILMDLTDLIDQYGVNMWALREHNPGFCGEMVSYDGGIYFLSRYYETVHTRHTQKIWMNMKWLENVGMEVPNTTEEFYEVLKAFKEQDANGNGDPNDEIPMIYFDGGYNSAAPEGIMQSFVYDSPQNYKLFVEDGVVKVSYAEEGWREGLRYLKRLYDEGLLDNELFSMTLDQAKALAADPNGNRVGCKVGGTLDIINFADDEVYNFEVIPPLEGPTGLRETALEFVSPTPFAAITSYCAEPEIAYRWLDAQLYDSTNDIANGDYTWLNFWYGEQGVGWDVADEGGTGFTGEPAAYKWLFNWGEDQNTHWYETFLINMPENWKPLIQNEQAAGYNQEQVLYNATVNCEYPYALDKTLHLPSLEEDVSVEMAELNGNLDTYYKSMMAKFVRGEADLDADWDSYLAELDKMGLQDYLAVYQEALDK
jgi:putative aldouronate transport system substrate-binding protein